LKSKILVYIRFLISERSPLREPLTYNRRTCCEKIIGYEKCHETCYLVTEVFTKLIEADKDPEVYEDYRQRMELSALYKAMLDSTPTENALLSI
jgi:hypothetical protein